MLKKRKLIYGLISLVLLLIIANVLIEKFKPVPKIKKVEELPRVTIEQLFIETLYEYGISSEWISKIKLKKKSDSLEYTYKIKLPVEVSIASFIKDVNSVFVDEPVKIESEEKKNYSNSEIKIYSNDHLKFDANIIHDRKLKREHAEYSFVVKIDNEITDAHLQKLSNLYFDYILAFIPSEFSSELISDFDIKYLVLLNDNINDSRFMLDEEFSKNKLENAIKEIIITYGRKTVYLIDEKAKLYNSKIYSLINDEFEKRGIRIYSLSSLTPLKAETKKQLQSLFNFYVTSLKGKEGKNFFVDYQDLLVLNPMIETQMKRGDKVNSPRFNQ